MTQYEQIKSWCEYFLKSSEESYSRELEKRKREGGYIGLTFDVVREYFPKADVDLYTEGYIAEHANDFIKAIKESLVDPQNRYLYIEQPITYWKSVVGLVIDDNEIVKDKDGRVTYDERIHATKSCPNLEGIRSGIAGFGLTLEDLLSLSGRNLGEHVRDEFITRVNEFYGTTIPMTEEIEAAQKNFHEQYGEDKVTALDNLRLIFARNGSRNSLGHYDLAVMGDKIPRKSIVRK